MLSSLSWVLGPTVAMAGLYGLYRHRWILGEYYRWHRRHIFAGPCRFCRIIEGDNKKETILYQDDHIMAFYDFRPSADTHILLIPINHIDSVSDLTAHHYDLVLKMQEKAHELLRQHGHDPTQCSMGFHIPPHTTIDHLHLSALGGKHKPERAHFFEIGKRWYLPLSQLVNDLQKKRLTVKERSK